MTQTTVTPVRLQLKNFLSYGTAAEPLDFGQFSVACLSGGNGQGKSALLDAITWAVWGEARKSAGAVKPDEELLRVGTQEMAVELEFDLEGQRYRVARSYTRTASGKTSKPGLEFAAWDDGAGEYRPLTAESVRATQAEIERRVRLDYDTFINSAFLLQGRSDEFTKKKPGERKEVLARILGLDRYEALHARASERWSGARERVKRAEETIERLQAALADEDGWRRDHAETQAHAAEVGARRDAARADEGTLADRLAALEAEARRARAAREALDRLDERRRRLDAEAGGLRAQVAEAEALVARADAIRAEHARYEALGLERAALDEKADQRRGLENLLQTARLESERGRLDLEGRLARLDGDLKAERERLAESDRHLLGQSAAETALRKARKAEEVFLQMKAQGEERRRIRARIESLDKQIASEKGRVEGHLAGLRARLRDGARAPAALAEARREEVTLEGRAREAEGWQQELERVREDGLGLGGRLEVAEADVLRLAEEIAGVEEKRALVRTTQGEACPTCGTRLSEEHRQKVEAGYDREREALERRRAARVGEAGTLAAERDRLRARYKGLHDRIRAVNGVAHAWADARARVRGLEEEIEALGGIRAEAEAHEERMARAAYLPAEQAERAELEDRLDAEPFDEALLERAQREAAQKERWEGALADLAVVAARREGGARRLGQLEAEAAGLRADLAEGRTLAPLRQRVAAYEAQLAALAYDGARHEVVRRELAALAGAPQALARLSAAGLNLLDWTRRLDGLAAEAAAAEHEAAAERAVLEASERALAERPVLAARHAEAAAARREAETALSDAQARLGGLQERLDRCARDRAALKTVRAELADGKREAALYRHLRDAFGRHGIPSLIIEEVVPEVEERANELLDRLSGGRTRVTLRTQGELKKGGTKETLDVIISDEQGQTRAYETFSGGEAFRVNFALRIALAQLLAERSGVRIRTLVVDEGFGTQDQEGLQSLIECIRAIQDDFDKVLVITHLDELKDAFPVRIEVTKRPVIGSTFEVLGV